MDLRGGQARLAEKALCFKKATLLCFMMRGQEGGRSPSTRGELNIPDYSAWSRSSLREHVLDLEDQLFGVLGKAVVVPDGPKDRARIARWLATHWDEWLKGGGGVYRLASVIEFEREVGVLRLSGRMETPAYGEMLLQGAHGMAIRHPEYMLVRDVGVLFDLHQDLDRMLDDAELSDREWATPAGENRQSLARAVVLACFNLLEAFSNGLAREWLLRNPGCYDDTRRVLEDMDKPLRTRLLSVVRATAAGRCSLDVNMPPMSILFGQIKNRRDAFVHCDPGPQSSRKGFVKEEAFHDVTPAVVTEAVRLTFEVIRTAWMDVYQRQGPLWLPEWEAGRFGKRNVRVARPAVDGLSTEADRRT